MTLIHQFTFKSEYEEAEKVENILNQLQQQLNFNNDFYAKLMLVVTEAVTNGIVHGNKLSPCKHVELKVFLDSAKNDLIFECEDEGAGFDPDAVPDPLAEANLLKPSGRGVYLMREFADDVSYTNNGTRLVLRFHLPEYDEV